jgi:hypothetical protein
MDVDVSCHLAGRTILVRYAKPFYEHSVSWTGSGRTTRQKQFGKGANTTSGGSEVNSRSAIRYSILFLLIIVTSLANAQTLVLQRSFIEKYKNRATIDAMFIVDHAHPRPNTPAKDGDLHASGRSDEVGLPMVSEVMNAAGATAVLNAIHDNEVTHAPTPISGAWRIWFEHPSTEPQVQFDDVPPAGNTNPDHCFEIHPITQYAGNSILDSLHEISGYTPKEAENAFGNYEKISATFEIDGQTVTITSKKVGFNYVKFTAQLAGKPESLDNNDAGMSDGQVVLANVMKDAGDEVLVDNVRLIFIAGTQPADELANAPEGATLELLALPRVDLNAISAFLEAGGSGTVIRKLPYEMIVVGARTLEE